MAMDETGKKKSKKEKKESSKEFKKEKSDAGGIADAVESNGSSEFVIKPESITPKIDTSRWPLLLKYYDQLHVVSSFSYELSIF